MADKNDFDWWINRDRDTCNVPCDEPIAGTTSAIREQLWFRWASPEELRDKVIEIVACYPNRLLASEDEDRLETIWDRAASVLSEQVSIVHHKVPQFVRDGLVEELKRTESPEEHDTLRRTLRWQHSAGFRCFLNQGVPEWSANRWVSAIDFEGVPQAPTAIECRVLQRIALECGNKSLSDAIGASYSLAGQEQNSTRAKSVTTQSTPEAQTATARYRARYKELKPMSRDNAAHVISEELGKSYAYIRKVLQGA